MKYSRPFIALGAIAALGTIGLLGTGSASADGHILVVDGVSYDSTKEAGAVIQWETPGPTAQTASFAERSQTWVYGDNGTSWLPCEFGIHWVSNDNNLVISGCVDGPSTTTTGPTTTGVTTTTGPTTTMGPTTTGPTTTMGPTTTGPTTTAGPTTTGPTTTAGPTTTGPTTTAGSSTTSSSTTSSSTTSSTTTTSFPTGGLFSFPAVSAQCTSTGNAIISITFPARPDLEGQVGTLTMQTSVGQTFTQSLTFLSGATVTVPYPAGIQAALALTYTVAGQTATATVTFPAGCAPATTTTTPGATTTTTAAPAVTTTTLAPTPNTLAVTPTTTRPPTTTQVPLTTPGALPKTGSDSTVPLIALASMLVLVGGVLMAARRNVR